MDIVQDVERDFVSSKPIVQATSTPDGLYLEPMTEYRGTRDEADLARFGKRQQLDVCTLIPPSRAARTLQIYT